MTTATPLKKYHLSRSERNKPCLEHHFVYRGEIPCTGPQICTMCGTRKDEHDCVEYAAFVITDGPIGHGWECAKCGRFLQAG